MNNHVIELLFHVSPYAGKFACRTCKRSEDQIITQKIHTQFFLIFFYIYHNFTIDGNSDSHFMSPFNHRPAKYILLTLKANLFMLLRSLSAAISNLVLLLLYTGGRRRSLVFTNFQTTRTKRWRPQTLY